MEIQNSSGINSKKMTKNTFFRQLTEPVILSETSKFCLLFRETFSGSPKL